MEVPDLAQMQRTTKTTITPFDNAIGWILILISAIPRVYEALRLHTFVLYGDSIHYDQSAIILVQRHFFSFWGYGPDAYVTPGYPLFLALCYGLAAHLSSLHSVAIHLTILIQAVLSALVGGFMYWIGRRFLQRQWAIVAILLWAVYPPAIWSITQILTETLYLFLLWLFLWLLVNAMERKQGVWWGLAGFALGLCGLVRPTVFPLVLVGVLYGLLRLRESQSLRAPIVWFGSYIVGFLIPIMPWWVRNFRLMHQVVLSDTEIGNPLLYGSDPNFQHDPLLGQGLSEAQQKHLAMARIQSGFSHHPLSTLHWYTIGKLDYLFGKPWYPPLSAHAAAFVQFWVNIHLLWVILGGIGIVLGLAVRNMRVLSLMALFFIVIQLPFIPINRYAFPLMSMLFLGLGYVLQIVIRRSGRRRSRRFSN